MWKEDYNKESDLGGAPQPVPVVEQPKPWTVRDEKWPTRHHQATSHIK